ncbi:MAG: TrmH family RNA methyltransferase [Anaerolineae bacterium]|nr:TrmH family RNA methyltransferase [Anaerolineae bacterium]
MDFRLKSYKKEFDHAYSFGVFATLELLDARPEHLLKVVLASRGERNAGVARLREACVRHCIPVDVNDAVIERLSPKESHLAIGVLRKYSACLDTDRNHLVLVNPGDMGNLGTIIRTMIGFGFTDLALIRPAVDIFDPRVIRASMGAVFRLTFEYFDHFDDYRAAFGHNLYLLMTNGQAVIDQVVFESPFALVFGNESSGLADEFFTLGTSIVIPHNRQIDSLNLSVAAGIALYQSTRNAKGREMLAGDERDGDQAGGYSSR